MNVVKVAILGFGTVGEGVYRTIQSHAEELTAAIGKRVEVAAVLIKNKQKQRDINDDVLITDDFCEILRLPQLDIVVEAIVGKEPALTFLKKSIERGCHIVTANKEMFARYGSELLELAEKHQVSVGFEATVAGGIPVIQTLRQLLKVNRINQIQGILNGTSNFILTEMRKKQQSFSEALQLAQENGFAELDPVNDVEGFDAFFKTMILCRIAFGEEPHWHEVERNGITSITRELIETADQAGLRFKHVASIFKQDGQIKASVKPVLVGNEHPFYHVEGVENAVNVYSDIVGRITLQGPGAGMFPTASAVIEDLTFLCQYHPSNKRIIQNNKDQVIRESIEAEELWLVYGVTEPLSRKMTVIDQLNGDTVIVKAAKNDIDALIETQKIKGNFSILAPFDGIINVKETVHI